MSKAKLPKGVETIEQAATKGGAGGPILREVRKYLAGAFGSRDVMMPGAPTKRGHYVHKAIVAKSPKIAPVREMAVRQSYDTPIKGSEKLYDVELFESHKVRALKKAATAASKAGKALGIAGLPFQYMEFREMMKKKPLHKREEEAYSRKM